MARNPIQFGKGLSLSEFQERYGTEEQCREAIVAWRWPKGFVCPACGCRKHAIVGKRRLYLCHGCRKQTSVIGLERVQVWRNREGFPFWANSDSQWVLDGGQHP
mgnify:FL=1